VKILFKLLGQNAELHLKKLGRYKIKGSKVRGLCDPPTVAPRKILVDSRLKGKERVEVILHECLHLAGWHLDEDFISQFAFEVAELLEKAQEASTSEKTR
jgi:beta-lactamase regulating signal transducer with metallopeptidase domain